MILQASWFIDYVPPWLAPSLIISGILAILWFEEFRLSYEVGNYRLESNFWFFLITVASIPVLYPWYLAQTDLFMFAFVIGGRWLEGVAGVRFLQKVEYLLVEHELSFGKSLRERAVYMALSFFVVIVSGWTAVYILARGPIVQSVAYDILLVWTLMTFITSALGVIWKVWSIKDTLPFSLLVGITICFAGVEIYNYTFLLNEILAFLLGSISYSLAYVVALTLWLRQ